jgi:hypothetical protein
MKDASSVVGEAVPYVPGDTVKEVLHRVGEIQRSELLGAYNVDTGKRFVNEQKDETVVLLLRAHPITNLGWILLSLLMLALPIILPLNVIFPVGVKILFMGKLIWYLLVMGYAFEKFIDWHYSVFIVTNERVVEIDFVNLLSRHVTYANLNHIEEPTMVSGGLIQSIFRYGNVHIPTAAERSMIEAIAVPYPERVISIISELSEELEKRRERGE